MNRKIVLFLILILYFSNIGSANVWVSDSSVISGLLDVGTHSTPVVYIDNSVIKLISGNADGDFYGYQWSGSAWVSNSSIVNGLSFSGVSSSPTVYIDNSVMKLISGENNGGFYGYQWSGSSWVSNSSIVNGLSDIGLWSKPTVYIDNSVIKLISGDLYGGFYGYQWSGSSWVSNSSIVNGLSNAGTRSTPVVYIDNSVIKLICGNADGDFYGYQWSGSAWVSNSSIVNGLSISGSSSSPTVYVDNSVMKLISGEIGGAFYGFYLNSIPTIPTLIQEPDYHTNQSITVEWLNSTDIDGDSLYYDVKVGTTSGGTDVLNEMVSTNESSSFNINQFETYYWSVRSNDTYELSDWSTEDSFSVINNIPTIPTSFTNLGNNLIDHTPTITWIKGTDADSDTVITYIYTGTTATPTTFEGSTTSETFNLGTNTTFTDGNTYYYRLRSYDGYEWSAYTTADEFRMNSIPSISNVTISPVPTIDTDDLTAHNDTATDAESDSITLYYRWYNNSILQTSLNDIVTVNQSNLTSGDVWKVGIIPNDGYENGTEIQSSTTTIGLSNVAPTTNGIITNISSIKYNKTLLVSTIDANDLNGDSYILHIGTASGLNNLCTSSLTPNGTEASCSFIVNYTSGSHTLYGRLTDGNDTSIERSIVYSIDTTPPVLNSSSISPTSFTNDESTTISASVTVANGTVDWVKVKIRDNAFISTNYTMSLVNGTYKYVYSPAAAGNYLITYFYASDDSGNIMSQSAIHAFEVVTGGTGGGTGGGAPPANVTIVGDLTLTPDRRDTYFFYTAISGEQKGVYQFVANRNVDICSVAPNSDATCEIVDGYIVEVTLTVNENVKAYDGVLTVADENNYVATSSLVVRIIKLWGALPIGTWEVGGLASLLDLFFETTETALVGIRTWFVALILGIFGFAFYKVYSL